MAKTGADVVDALTRLQAAPNDLMQAVPRDRATVGPVLDRPAAEWPGALPVPSGLRRIGPVPFPRARV